MPINLTNISKATKPYTLVSKVKGIDVNSSLDLAERIGLSEAKTADVVIIAKTDNPLQRKIITTYRDENNNVVEMIHEHEGLDIPDTHRLYQELPNYGFDVKGRLVQLFENLDITNRIKAWKKVSSEKQYVAFDAEHNKTHLTVAKVSTNERTLKPTISETHSITEYAIPKAHCGRKVPKKYLILETEKDSVGIPKIKNTNTSSDVTVPENDEYLPLRMYDADDVKIPITRMALRKNGLQGLNIAIQDEYKMKKSTLGQFNYTSGAILFNFRDIPKPEVINTGYHEACHAFQYAIMAITKKIKNTLFANKCVEKFKGTITPQIEKDADRYYNAHLIYTLPEENYHEYWNNLLEVEARDAGNNVINDYIVQGFDLADQFPRIPNYEI